MTSDQSSNVYIYRGGGYYYNSERRQWEVDGVAPPINVTNVSVHPSVTSIGRAAFSGCTSLEIIALPSNITSIGRAAFEGCASLISIQLPPNLTSIDDCAFQGCTSLRNITLPPNITSIDNFAFKGCTSLESIKLPPNLTSIKDYAFGGCSLLTDIALPQNLTSIGHNAFSGCASLENVTLPANLTSIKYMAFSHCTSLRSVIGPTANNESCHNLHSFLNTMTLCAGDFIDLAIRLHPEQLEEVDADGNLPLHIAASSSTFTSQTKTHIIKKLLRAHPEAAKIPNNKGNLPLHIRSSSKGDVEDFYMLLSEYNEAAKVPNNYGKLPLFMALEGRTQWNDGVQELMKAFPEVTIQADTETNLFPFMTAATKETNSCLNSVYSLMITCPEMNVFYHAKGQEDNQIGSRANKDERYPHSSKRQKLE